MLRGVRFGSRVSSFLCSPVFSSSFHSQLEPLVPHLNPSLLRIAKTRFESRMPDKLFDLLQEKLFVYYSLEERFDEDISVEERRNISKSKSALSQYVYAFEEYCKKLIELKETLELKKLVEDASEREALEELENEIIEAASLSETEMFSEIVKPEVSGESNVILEIRAGVGGQEAAIFAKEISEMYQFFADSKGWKYEVMSCSLADAGGYKEITAGISGGGDDGLGIFGSLQFETGAHRVQRVPATESSGRIHTSAITVAVLPEMKDVDVNLRQSDIRIDLYRSSGPGGQHVNCTDSAVRLTHLPTGIVVAIQDERSQHKNKDKAMRVLRARIFEKEKQKQQNQRQEMRQQQIGSGDRSEKIRTYNFPQNRITDHRINYSAFGVDRMLKGELCDEFAAQLTEQHEKERLEQILSNPSVLGF